jgi:hypothetical protein
MSATLETLIAIPSAKISKRHASRERSSILRTETSLLGEIVENASVESQNRALVRWRSADGLQCERWLMFVQGLNFQKMDHVLLQRPTNGPDWIVTGVVAGLRTAEMLDARVDGKRIVIDGKDEIVLRCGHASITLRRNGRVVIRGTYVESRSKGTNRIKGGSVLIN